MLEPEYYEIELPGKVNYPEGTKVEVKKITPFEQKKFYSDSLNAETEDERQKALQKFIKGVTKCTNIEFEDLYYPDYTYLLYQIREVTYKLFPLSFIYDCPECNEKQKIEIKINELLVNTLDEKLPETITLDNFGEVPIRFKKVKDDNVVSSFLKSHGENPEDLMMRILAAELLLLENWQPIEETWEMAQNGQITLQDTTRIENYIADHIWGVIEEVKSKCRKCGKEEAVSYNIDPASFFSANNE